MKKENEIDFYSLQTLLSTLEMLNDDSANMIVVGAFARRSTSGLGTSLFL